MTTMTTSTTYPGRKDSMESYAADRHPHLAPFDWFGRNNGQAAA